MVAAYGVDAILPSELLGQGVEEVLLVGYHDEVVPAFGELSTIF